MQLCKRLHLKHSGCALCIVVHTFRKNSKSNVLGKMHWCLVSETLLERGLNYSQFLSAVESVCADELSDLEHDMFINNKAAVKSR